MSGSASSRIRWALTSLLLVAAAGCRPQLIGDPLETTTSGLGSGSATPLEITSLATGDFINQATSGTTFPISGTCDTAGQTVTIQVDGVNAASQVGGLCNGATWSATVDVTGLTEAAHSFAAQLTDAAGNTQTSSSNSVTKDVTAPTVTLALAGGQTASTMDFPLNYDVTFSQSSTFTVGQLSFTGTATGAGAGITGSGTSYAIAINSLTTAGAVTPTIAAGFLTDAAGNPSAAASAAVSFRETFVQVVTGNVHSCGLSAQGQAFCWGSDSAGQLGNGAAATANQEIPSAVDTAPLASGDRFVQLTAAGATTCGLTGQGAAYCWGADNFGELGNGSVLGSSSSPSPVSTTRLAAGERFVSLDTGGDHTCGLTSYGLIYCWGRKDAGRLGNPAAANAEELPLAIDTSNLAAGERFVSLSVGYNHSCGVTAQGQAYCWGDDSLTALGNGGVPAFGIASAVDRSLLGAGDRFVSVSVGSDHTCGITSQGQTFCWGEDDSGQLGNGSAMAFAQSVPYTIDTLPLASGDRFVSLSAGQFTTCGLTARGQAFCWGSDAYEQLGNSVLSGDQTSPSAVSTASLASGDRFASLSVGNSHVCGATTQGQAFCWGYDLSGKLGNGTTLSDQNSPSLTDTTGLTVGRQLKQVVVGSNHSCGFTERGAAYCWGNDADGQLGNGAALTANQSTPSIVDTTSLAAGDRFVSLTSQAGGNHVCGLTAQGQAFCWGDDSYGQLGNGAALTADQSSPSPVDTSTLAAGDRFVALYAGGFHTCGITAQGQSYCWGRDDFGQLGNGAPGDQTSPSLVDTSVLAAGSRFVSFGMGTIHSCGITTLGLTYCWGNGSLGRLGVGVGSTSNQTSPTLVDTSPLTAGDRFVSLTAGGAFTCGLTALGLGYCWGHDGAGRLGNGAGLTADQEIPSPIDTSPLASGDRFVSLAAGGVHACGVTSQGLSFCWGDDIFGALGNGAAITGSQESPSAAATTWLATGERLIKLTGGAYHSCGTTSQGRTLCWGEGSYGALGFGTSTTYLPYPITF